MKVLAPDRVVLVHDYLTQLGGAERVVLALAHAFPEAPIITSVYAPDKTFPEFREHKVHAVAGATAGVLRRDHRLGLPEYHAMFRRLDIDADLVVCSTSAFAHVVRTAAPKLVYCHNPPRWLYQLDEYVGPGAPATKLAARAFGAFVRPLDVRAARESDRYLANSSAVRERIARAYGLDAQIVHPPPALRPEGPRRAIPDVAPGYLLLVSRLLPYKNVDLAERAMVERPGLRLVVVGDGPQRRELVAGRPENVTFLGRVADDELRWLYANAAALVCPSLEDFGLTPLEAASFGVPAVALRAGGYLDTVAEGATGVFFDRPRLDSLLDGIDAVMARDWVADDLRAHARRFAEEAFAQQIRRHADQLTR